MKTKVKIYDGCNAYQSFFWVTYMDGKDIYNSPVWNTRKKAIRWAERHGYEVID